LKTKQIAILGFLMLTIGVSNLFAQQVNFAWAKQIGGPNGYQTGNSIAVDDSGNVYVTGSFKGTVDFDPGLGIYNLTSVGVNNTFVAKLDSAGNLKWVKQIGAENSYSIVLDGKGGVYTTGNFIGTADFDPGVGTYYLTTNIGAQDIFISKLDASGSFVWVKQMLGYNGVPYSLTLDKKGNIYSTGGFQGTVDFDPGPNTYNLICGIACYDVYVSKLDSLGDFIWAKQVGGKFCDLGKSISVDTFENVYLTGEFEDTVDFDPGVGVVNLIAVPNNNGMFFIYNDLFVLKLDSLGDFDWVKQIGSRQSESANGIVVAPSGNIYCTGVFSDTIDFDSGVGVFNIIGRSDIFILKLNPLGHFVWVKSMTGGGGNYYQIGGNVFVLDSNENIYTTGIFDAHFADYDPGIGTYIFTNKGPFGQTSWDIFVSKLDSSGSFVWAKQIGGVSDEKSLSITLDDLGNVYTIGFFFDTTDFDPTNGTYNLSAISQSDIFIHKMSQCIIDTSVTQNGTTLTSNVNGASYQWIDCSNGYNLILGATNQSYTAITGGSYAVVVTLGDCSFTSICHSIAIASVKSNFSSETIMVAPNPTNGQLVVFLNKKIVNGSIRVFNVMGQTLVEKSDISGIRFFLNISNQTNGIYFLEVRDAENAFTVKLIKN